jgi:hypothetical protein
LSVAAGGTEDKWKDVAYPLVFWYVVSQIIQNIGNSMPAGGAKSAFSTIFQILEAILQLSATVMFGKAATAYAKAKYPAGNGTAYSAAACCDSCGFSLACDDFACGFSPDLWCCLTYWCCWQCHFVQIGHDMEKFPDSVGNIMSNRPAECKDICCNCWSDKQAGTAAPPQQGTDNYE